MSFDVGAGAYSVAVGDLNGDSKPDLVTASYSAGTVSVLLGNGDGTFGARTDYPAGNNVFVGLADLDSDGDLDLVYGSGGGVTVRLGNGDGAFGDATSFADASPRAIGDVNGDSHQDLVLLGASGGTVRLGIGDGTFGPGIGNAAVGLDVAVGTLNADTNPDLVVANYNDRSISVLLGNGDGTFGAATAYPLGNNPFSVAIGNLDGIGGLDICAGMNLNGSLGIIMVLLGNGDGTFGEAAGYEHGEAVDVVIADFSGDGKADVATAGYVPGSVGHVSGTGMLLGNGDGTFGPVTDVACGPRPNALATGDLNADGKPDLAAADFTPGTASVLLGNGDGTFGSGHRYSFGLGPSSVAAGDLNHDGFPDLAVGAGNTQVLLGNGDGTFATATFVPASNTLAAIGDLNGDTHLDLVVLADAQVAVLLGNGNGTFGPRTNFYGGNLPVSAAIGDLGGIGGPDLVVATHQVSGQGIVMVLLGIGGGAFAAGTSYVLGSDPAGLAVADLDGDGDLDVAAARDAPTAIAPVAVMLGNGDGTLGPSAAFGSGGRARSVAIGDLNADGMKDLVLGGTSGLRVLVGNGDGTFGSQGNYAAGNSFESVAVGDVDGDGKPDVVATSGLLPNHSVSANTVSVMPGNGDGTLGPKTDYGTGRGPSSFAVADVNGDGRPDLATADNRGNTATVLMNLTEPTTAVLLSRFEAAWAGEAIEVRWQFGTEAVALSTTLERSEAPRGPWAPVSGTRWDDAGVAVVRDAEVVRDRLYFYRLVAAEPGGGTMTFGPISTSGEAAPSRFALLSIDPNPTLGRVRITFVTPEAAPVRISVLDVMGRRVELLANEMIPAGRHEVVWDAGRLSARAPAGLYFVRLDWPGGSATRRLALTR